MAQPFPATREDWELGARCLWGEARGEAWDGQVAVAWVIRNRAERPGWWGHTVSEVVLHPRQFSVFNESDPNRPKVLNVTSDDPTFRRCLGIFALVLSGDLSDPTNSATHYFTAAPPSSDMAWPPAWSMKMRQTARIGHHVFLRDYFPSERTQA